MKIKIKCPHCSIKMEATGDVIGTVVSCPTCCSSIHVGKRERTAILNLGTYQGTCVDKQNEKTTVSRLSLTITRQENDIVQGKVKVTGDLDAEMEFEGKIVGNQINFITSTPEKKFTIEWSAEIQGDCLRGNFASTDTRFWSNLFGTSTNNQQGEWQCKKERFPIIRRLKTFTKRAIGLLIIGAIVCALIASDKKSESFSAYEAFSQPSNINQLNSERDNSNFNSSQLSSAYTPKIDYSSQPFGHNHEYKPRVSAELVATAASKTYDYVLDQKRVDVSGYVRDNTYIHSYTRQPPGGFSFDDKMEAAGWAGAVAAGIITLDWFDQKLEERKHKKQWPYSSSK